MGRTHVSLLALTIASLVPAAAYAADPAYAGTRAEHERRLLDELKQTGDPRLDDDGRFFETPPMSGPAGQ